MHHHHIVELTPAKQQSHGLILCLAVTLSGSLRGPSFRIKQHTFVAVGPAVGVSSCMTVLVYLKPQTFETGY